jgi:hypothetical protein
MVQIQTCSYDDYDDSSCIHRLYRKALPPMGTKEGQSPVEHVGNSERIHFGREVGETDNIRKKD